MLPFFARLLAWLLLTPVFLLALPRPWLLAPTDGRLISAPVAIMTPVVQSRPAAVASQPLRQSGQLFASPALPSPLPARVITVMVAAPPARLALAGTHSTPAPTLPAKQADYPAPLPTSLSRVDTDLLNLRSGPDSVFPIITEISEGEPLTVVGRTADCTWLQVRTAAEASGWVVAAYVTQAVGCEQLPIVAVDLPVAARQPAAVVAAQVALPAAGAERAPAPPAACGELPNEHYDLLAIEGAPTTRPAAQHPDVNLAVRGYEPTQAELAVIEFDAADDPLAPQLAGLFADRRIPALHAAYQVYDWDWGCDCRGPLLALRGASLAGLAVQPGEPIYTPDSGRGLGSGYEVLVLYASENQLTLKYTREDNVVAGYTLHLAELCVEPRLLALYHSADQAGRQQLPALRAGQRVGQAAGNELKLAIRDTGDFMDPRDQEDWWRVR